MPIIEIPGKGNVEFPDGMPHEEILAKVREFSGAPPPDPTKGPIPQGVDTPNKFSRILGIANQVNRTGNAGNESFMGIPLQVPSAEAKLGLVTPGGGPLIGGALKGAAGFLSRMGVQGAGQGAGALARGEGLEAAGQSAAKGILGQAAGEGIVKAGKAAHAATPTLTRGLNAFGKQAEEGILKHLQGAVPAWKGMKSAKDMLHTQEGYDALHQAYDDSLKEVISKGAGKMIQVPEAAAQAFKLETGGGIPGFSLSGGKGAHQFPPALLQRMQEIGGTNVPTPQAPGMIGVDAAQAAKAITGMWKKNPEGYRAIVNALDDAGIGDPAARAAYKEAMGATEYFGKLKAFEDGPMDILKAQRGLNVPVGEELLKRGLEAPYRNILNPGGGPLISKGTMAAPFATGGAGLGAILGGLGLGGLGHVGAAGGAIGGASGMGYLGNRLGSHIPTFKNVPQIPADPRADFLRSQLLQSLLQQGAAPPRNEP